MGDRGYFEIDAQQVVFDVVVFAEDSLIRISLIIFTILLMQLSILLIFSILFQASLILRRIKLNFSKSIVYDLIL